MGERGLPGCEEGEDIGCPAQCPSPPLPTLPGTGVPTTFPIHLVVGEARVGEGREVGGTGRSLGEASQAVDLTAPSILVLPEVDRVSRIDGGVLVKKVVGSEEEAHAVLHSHCVGNVLCMGHVQETGCHPGHQVLMGVKKEDHEVWLC